MLSHLSEVNNEILSHLAFIFNLIAHFITPVEPEHVPAMVLFFLQSTLERLKQLHISAGSEYFLCNSSELKIILYELQTVQRLHLFLYAILNKSNMQITYLTLRCGEEKCIG